MKILLVGARGFIGTALLEELRRRKHQVKCLTRGALPEDIDPQVRWFKLDTLSQKSWDEAVDDDIDVIYHFGWSTTPRTSANDPPADLVENVGGSLRLLASVRSKGKMPRFIFASSGGTIYGRTQDAIVNESHALRPISSYGLCKLAFETFLQAERREHGLDSVSVRISNPYGPSQNTERAFGAISTFIRRALKGESISIFGSGDIVRDYIYITDAAQALVKLAEAPDLPDAVNLGSGTGTSLSEIIAAIEGHLGRRLEVELSPGRQFDVERIVLDISRIKSLIEWRPTVSLAEGIERTIVGRSP